LVQASIILKLALKWWFCASFDSMVSLNRRLSDLRFIHLNNVFSNIFFFYYPEETNK